MDFPRVALKAGSKQFGRLIDLGTRVAASLAGNLHYAMPTPSLLALNAKIAEVVAAKVLWQATGNRGSSIHYSDLCQKARELQLMLKELAQYVSNTAEQAAGMSYGEMRTIMLTSGFDLAAGNAPIGLLQPVADFRRLLSRSLSQNVVKLKWKRPLGVAYTSAVKLYEVRRGTTSDFNASVSLGFTTKSEFIDTNDSLAMVMGLLGSAIQCCRSRSKV